MLGAAMKGFGNTAAAVLGKCLHTSFAHTGLRRVSCSTPLLLGAGMCSVVSAGCDDAGSGTDGWSCRHINLTRCSRSFCCLPRIAFIPIRACPCASTPKEGKEAGS